MSPMSAKLWAKLTHSFLTVLLMSCLTLGWKCGGHQQWPLQCIAAYWTSWGYWIWWIKKSHRNVRCAEPIGVNTSCLTLLFVKPSLCPQMIHYLQKVSIPGLNIPLPEYILLSLIDFCFRIQPQLNFGGKISTLSSFTPGASASE